MKTALRHSNLTLLAVVSCAALAYSVPVQASDSKIRINERFPLKTAGELSPPTVGRPIHQCAKIVFVSGFIPGAAIHVFSGAQLVGHENNTVFGFTTVHLNRELNTGEKITATQTALGLTSAHSYYPVLVEPYDPSGLTKPVVSRDIFDCGQVVPVNNLVPSAWVNVFDNGSKIGTDETTGTGDAIVTSPLVKSHPITAQQTACPDQPALKVTGPMSAAVRVKPSPNPPPFPSVDQLIVGNNAVALHGLFVGAQVEVRNAGTVIGGGLATASDNWCPVSPPIPSNPSVQAKQTLCSPSALSPPQTGTVPINQLIILPPVCDASQQVTIRGAQVNATVVLLRGGSQIVGYGGAVPGDLVLQVGGAMHLSPGDVLTAVQYMGNNSSTPSQPVTVGACADVVTYHNDNSRTGLNPSEKLLTPASVNPKNFGKLFSHQVDGYLYAEPLYLAQLSIPGKGTHNVVFVATQHDSVYAFDADSNAGANADPLWHTSFTDKNAGVTSVPTFCDDILIEIGITGTPVIDRTAGTLYVVAKTLENQGGHGHYIQRLHALDVTTGIERPGGPKVIGETICDDPGSCGPGQYVSGPTVPGTGENNDGSGHVLFNAFKQAQRSGLALVNGVVYAAWGSHCDDIPYHGWIIGFDAQSLSEVAVFNTTPNATSPDGLRAGGGVWQGGAAPAADANGALYFATGNGVFEEALNANGFPNQADFGDSILKLVPDPASSSTSPNANGWGLKAADYFTPYNEANLTQGDTDLGSGGVLLLPDQPGSNPHLLIGAGKGQDIYVLNREQLGKFHAGNDSQIVQTLPGVIQGVWGMAAYFNQTVYYSSADEASGPRDYLKAFSLSGGKLSIAPTAKSAVQFTHPGATPSISGSPRTGIVWALENSKDNTGVPTILHAFRADTLQELYSSTMAANNRDLPPGYNVKFSVPAVANGKVYVGTSSSLTVFGNLFQTRALMLKRPPPLSTTIAKPHPNR